MPEWPGAEEGDGTVGREMMGESEEKAMGLDDIAGAAREMAFIFRSDEWRHFAELLEMRLQGKSKDEARGDKVSE